MEKLKPTPLSKAIRTFLQTTTLHGFKYLGSKFYIDRIGWFLCCCASASCAGLLCTVLWARFLEVPALLALYDLKLEMSEHQLPVVAVCPTVESIAEAFIDKLSHDKNLNKRLPLTLAHVLKGKPAADDQIQILDHLLTVNNVTLLDIMRAHMPPCHAVIKKCRWQNIYKSCDILFDIEVTPWGLCCVLRPNKKLANQGTSLQLRNGFQSTLRLDLAVQCFNDTNLYNFEFFTKYDGEEWIEPMQLAPGNTYMAQLRYTSIPESTDTERLIEESCVSRKGYSRSDCLKRCSEKICGCVDPLRGNRQLADGDLLPCSLTELKCLRSYGVKGHETCNCAPSCKKVTAYTTLESSPLNFNSYVIDPIYGLNATSSVVMHVRVNINLSRIFTLNPTETWFTLLSSLGGVFNMFLGVGLFSALELLYLFFIKLPNAMRRSSEFHYGN
uniref:Sodium channel protein Nach n=1 Tax=Bombyx mori TaxID=7091 RepID=A0A8R2QY48_BOMMO|nr:sodium channel protein Nach isoform X2 [Bombyx mori]